MNKKMKKAAAALSLCIAMVAASFCNTSVAQAQVESQPPIQVPVSRQPLKLNVGAVQIEKGGKYQLSILDEEDAGKAVWSSSNKSVAKVTQKGRVESLGVGTTTITAKIGKRKSSCTVTIVPVRSIGNLFYGLWQSDYYASGVYLSSYDMATPMNNLLKNDISVEKYQGYSFVRVAAYTKVDGVPTIHIQARKGGKRISVFLTLHSEKGRQVLNFNYANGSNPDSSSNRYSQTYYAYRPTK